MFMYVWLKNYTDNHQDATPIIDDVEESENKKSNIKKIKTKEKDELNSKSILRSNDGVNISQKGGKRALFSER